MWKYLLILSVLVVGGEEPLREARLLSDQGEWSASLAAYQEARRTYPTMSASISYNVGLTYLRLEEPDLAREAFFQALSPLTPRVASLASNQTGILMVGDGRPREALSSFREALLFDPENEDARYNYELLALRLSQNQSRNSPPPPMQGPPPPPDQEPQVQDPFMEKLLEKLANRQRRTAPVGDKARPVGGDTLSMPESYQVLELMYKQERQYVQQLRKISSPSAEREGKPSW